MKDSLQSRRRFLQTAATTAGAVWLSTKAALSQTPTSTSLDSPDLGSADYTLRIKLSPVEISPNKIISTTTYNGQLPGPLIRLKEGKPVTVDIFNDTDVAEQLHWHGQKVPAEVDGASEEGTPFIPAHGKRRITFTPGPAGLRFYHTHNRAGANLSTGQYSGQVGPVYIEPKEKSRQL